MSLVLIKRHIKNCDKAIFICLTGALSVVLSCWMGYISLLIMAVDRRWTSYCVIAASSEGSSLIRSRVVAF